MSHTALRREFSDLIDLEAPVDRLAGGFTFTEGPIWHPRDQYLLFSDMPADIRRRWDERGGVREVMQPSNKCNGMTYDANLGLIVCEHATSSLIRERDGRREVLASHFQGKELNSPNDVCVRSDGSIYFSDPWYGRMPVYGVERPRQQGFQGVYRVPPGGGEPQLLVDRHLFEQPNGLCFSPDEKLLYVNDTVRCLIRVFDVNADGTLGPDRIFASGIRSELEPGVPDGMKCDGAGNIWVTAPGGVSYGYDGLGRLATRTTSTGTSDFAYSGTGDTVASDGTTSYSYDPGGDLVTVQSPGGTAEAALTDVHGDVIGLFSPAAATTTLAASAAYSPYGTVTVRSGSMPSLGYQGQYTDPSTGDTDMSARWYSPSTSTFTSLSAKLIAS